MEKRRVINFDEFTKGEIYSELLKIREYLETKWDELKSNRQCIRTVYFINKVLGGDISGGWVSSNPKEHEQGGFLDKNGKWNFHYWNIIGDYIIDITSDQFGEDKINILDKSDRRYISTSTKMDIKQDFRYTGDVVDVWIDEYKKLNSI